MMANNNSNWKSDYNEAKAFMHDTLDSLSKRGAESNEVLFYRLEESIDIVYFLRIYEEVNNRWKCLVIRWYRRKDLKIMSDPLEKVKFYGQFYPTIDNKEFNLNKTEKEILERKIKKLKENHENQITKTEGISTTHFNQLLEFRSEGISFLWGFNSVGSDLLNDLVNEIQSLIYDKK